MRKLCAKDNDIIASDLSLKNQFCVTIYQTANKVARLYGKLLMEHGITFPQYQALLVLWDHEPCTVGALCTALTLDTSTLTPVLKRLQTLGFVDRFRDRIDERRVYVSLTEKGRAFRLQAWELRCKLVDDLNISMHEFLELQGLLHKVSGAIDRVLPSRSL